MSITVGQAVTIVHDRHKREGSPTSLPTQATHASASAKHFGPDRDLNSISAKDVQNWIDSMRGSLAPETIRIRISYLRKLYRVAEEELGVELTDPTQKRRRPAVCNKRDRVLSEPEEELLRTCLDAEEYAMVQFAIHTGMRRLEQWWLKPADLQFFSRPVEGVQGLRATELVGLARITTSKTGKGRMCPLNRVAAAIARYFAERGGLFLFRNSPDHQTRFERMKLADRFVKTRFFPALRTAQIEGLHWHDLRHTTASRALRNGARLEQVQLLLGHSSVVMTERYSHWDQSALWPAADALVGRLNG